MPNALTARITVALAAVVALSSGLVACSSSGTPSPRTDDGMLTVAVGVVPDSWDPHVSPADVTGGLLRPVFDSLVAQRPDGTLAPWLATSWKVSKNGLTYTFELRRDVTFSDGTRFDAAAVKANFDHVVAPETASKWAGSLIGPYDRTETPGDFTAVVHLKKPYSSLLWALSTTYLGMQSPVSLRDHADDLVSGAHAVGTGPFRLSSVVAGQRAVLEKRADYAWASAAAAHQGPARLDKVVIQFLPESAAKVGAVTSGQADLADHVPATRLAEIRRTEGVSVVRAQLPGVPYSYYLNSSRPPLDNVDARRAIRYAIDFDGIVNGVFRGEYKRTWSPLTPASVVYAPDTERSWGYDKAKADALLDQLGYTGRDAEGYRTRDGKRFTLEMPYVQSFVSPEHHAVDIGVQDALKQVGVEMRLLPLDSAASQGRTRGGDYDMFAFSWGGTDPGLLYNLFHSSKQFADGGANAARTRDAELDHLLEAARADASEKHGAEHYRQVQRRVIDQAYSLPVYTSVRDTLVRSTVGDLVFDTQGWPDFHGAWVVRP